MKRNPTGDGDRCPQDPEHGHMWVLSSKNQFCPSSAHRGGFLYCYDGVTPLLASPALDALNGGSRERTTGQSNRAVGAP